MIEEIRELQRALNSDPSNRQAFDALADQYAAASDWRRLRWHYERYREYLDAEADFAQLEFILRELADAEESAAEKSAILVALGDVLFEHLENHDEGMSAYQDAFRTFPEDTLSLERARRIYRKLGQFKRVLLIYDLERGVKKGTPAEYDVLIRVAQVHGEHLGDRDEALSLLDEVEAAAPEHELVSKIRVIYAAGGTIEAAVKDKVREAHQVAQAGEQRMASKLLVEAAQLDAIREGADLKEALELAEKARSFDAENDEARELAEQLMAALKRNGDIQEFEDTPSAQLKGAEAALNGEASLDEDSLAADGGQPDEIAHSALNGLDEASGAEAEVSELQAPSDASNNEEEQPEEEPEEEESAAEEQGKPQDEDAEAAKPQEVELEESAPLDDYAAARAQLSEDPADLRALGVVREQLREEGALEELAEQLEKSLKYLRKKDGELEVMVEVAGIYWRELGDLDKAEYYFKRVKLLDQEQPEMVAFYEDFYQQNGEWRKLFSLLSSRQGEVEDEEASLELARRLAQIAEIEMQSPEKAIDVWRQFERDWSDHPHAREQLRRLYEENGKWNALVDFLKERVRKLEELADESGEDNAGARVLLLERIAEVYRDELRLDSMVINTLSTILVLEPEHSAAFGELREKLAGGRRWNDLAGLLTERAELASARDEKARAVELYLEVADIWQENLRNTTQALPHLEQVLKLEPENEPVRRRLAEIYEQRRDWESLFDLRFGEVESLEDGPREELLDELLSLAEDRLSDPDRMVMVLEKLREIRPDDSRLLERLEFIHRRADDHAGLADALEARAALLKDAAEEEASRVTRLGLLREAAELREEKCEDLPGAARIWRELLGEDADDHHALGRLTEIYIYEQDFDDLQALYARRDALEELYELIVIAAESGEDERRRALYRRAADIAADELEDRPRAVSSLRELASLQEDPRAVARELIAHFEAMEDLDGQVEGTRILLEHAEALDERAGYMRELGELCQQNEDLAGALEWFLQAATAQPQADEVLAKAEEVAGLSDSTGLFVEHLELIAEHAELGEAQEESASPEVLARLWRRLGRVLRDDQQDYPRSIEYFERLREQDPSDLKTLDALEELYARTEQSEARIETLRSAIHVLTEGGADRIDLIDQLSKVADVQRTHLGEADQARSTYVEILDLEPNHLGALRGIRELHRADANWEEVVDLLQREISIISLDDIDARIAAQMNLADTLRLKLGDLRESIHCYGQVLAESPQHEGAVEAVEALLAEPGLAREAALMLEPIFRDTDRPAQLVRALEARREVANDRFEKAEILDELIPLYHERLEETPTAFERACRQFELDPGREEIWLRVEQLGAELNRWADIEEIFAKYTEGADAGAVDVRLLRHLAAIREYRLNKPQEALASWERVYEADPTDSSVVDALDRLHRQLGNQQELVEILHVRESLCEHDEARIDILLEIADLSDSALDDPVGAVDAYRRILLLEQDHQAAVEALERLYRASQDWIDLDELYVSQADLAVDPDRRREFLLKLGILRAEEVADFAGSSDILSQLVLEDPGDAQAAEALENVDAALKEQSPDDPLRFEIARVLEPVYRNHDAYSKLAGVLEIRQAHAGEVFEQVALLDELVELYLGRLGDKPAALDAIKRAVRVEPENAGRRGRLLEICVAQNCLDEAAQTLEDAALEADMMSVGPIYRQLGGLYEDLLGQPERAIEAFERALEQDESDEDSLSALQRLYQHTNRDDKLAENLRQQVQFAGPERRVELLGRAATLYEEQLDRPDEAIRAYLDLLDEQPDSQDAFDGLERVLSAEARWLELTDVLRRRVEASYEEGERVGALERMARVFAEELKDQHEAISVYQEILTLDPGHRRALDQLEQIFEQDAQWHDLSEVLRSKLAAHQAQAGDEFDGLQLKLADTLRLKLFEVDEALGLYRTVLERTPGQPEAIGALKGLVEDPDYAPLVTGDLVAHLRRNSKYEELVELYQTRAEQSYEPHEKAEFFEKSAQIWAENLQDPLRAVEAMGEAWKLEPERTSLRDRLVELVQAHAGAAQEDEAARGWERLAEIYQDMLTVVLEPELLLELYTGLAEIYRDQLDDPIQVEANFREVLLIDERHELAYNALESLLIRQDRWLDFVELLEQKFNISVLEDPSEARDTLLRIALAQEEQLDDDFSAVETYTRALELDERDPTANNALSRLLRAQERWPDLVEHLRRRMARSRDPEETNALSAELAELLRRQMHDPEGAIELYRALLQDEPEHQEALGALEEMFAELFDEELGEARDPRLRADIAVIIEPAYRRQQAWAKLVDALLARVEVEDSKGAANGLLLESARLSQVELQDPVRAAEIMAEVFKRSPSDQSVRLQLHDLHAQTGDWRALTELYDDVLANQFEVDDELRVELLAERGALAEERLSDLEDARRAWGEVLLFDVEHKGALDATERLLIRSEDWHDLAEFYRDRADVARHPLDSIRWLERLATLYEEVLDELDEAIAVYGRVYDLEPDDADIQQTLARLYGHAHRWHDLADLYRRRIDLSVDPQQVMELKFRLAGLLESELDLIEDALQIYQDILSDTPGHQETLRALEGLQRDLSQRDDERAHYRPQIIDLLLEHYNEQNHWRRIADLLEEKQQLVDDVEDQVSALSLMAEVIQRSASDEADKMRGLDKLTRAFCIDPTNEKLGERVKERAESLGAWERVVPIYLQGLETDDNPDTQAALLIAIAEAYEGPLSDRQSAITAYQAAVDINSSSRALSRLQRLYGELELWEPLVGVLRKRLEGEYDGEARQGLLKRIATIYDEILDWSEDATRAYEELREEDPGEVSVHRALARLYRGGGHWAELEETLQTLVSIVEDDQVRHQRLLELAELQDEKLDQSLDAISTYRQALAEKPEDHDTLKALSRLFESSQNWPELLDNLELEARFAQTDEEKNAVDMRVAIVWMDKLENPLAAIEPMQRIIERDPAHIDARGILAELFELEDAREEAAEILQNLYLEQEESEALKELYEQRLTYVELPDLRAEIFLALAKLQEEAFGSNQMAFMTLGRALSELPTSEEIRQELERLSQLLDNIDELAAVYEDTLEIAVLDPDIELELRRRTGEIYAKDLEDPGAAIRHFEAALQIDEYDQELLDWLDQLYQLENRWADLAEILQTRLATAPPERLNDVRFRLGYLREVVFGEHHDALDLYRQIIIEEPEHLGALEGLGRMAGDLELRREISELLEPSYTALEAHEALAELFELKLEIVDTDAERAELLKRIAGLQLDHLNNLYAGYAYLGRALREDPHDIDVQERLEELAKSNDLEEQLVALYEDIIDAIDDPIRAGELALSAGDTAYQTLEEPERAVRLYQLVLKVEPEHADALQALEDIARAQDEPEALEAVLSTKADALFDPDERKKVLLELGEVRMRLELFDEAIAAYQDALTLDEGELEILHQLVALYEITERYDDLVDTLERLATYIKDVDQQRLLYVRIGQYTRHFIHAPERSIRAYRQADLLKPDDPNVLKALEGLYTETGEWHELLEIVERQLGALQQEEGDEEIGPDSPNAADYLRLYVSRARVNYAQFNEVDRAIADYQRAFALQKDSPVVVEALDELYRNEQRWQDLIALYHEQLQIVSEQPRLIELYVEMADISQRYLDDEDTTFELLDMVLEIEPGHERALDILQTIYERRQEWAEVVDVLTKKALAAEHSAQKIAHLQARAEVQEARLEAPISAAETLIEILEIDPAHPDTLEKLKALYRSIGEYQQLYTLMEHEVGMLESDEDRVALYLEMAQLARAELGSAQTRIEALEQAYQLRPDDLDIVEPLLDAYIDGEDFEAAEPILDGIIDALQEKRQMADVVRFEHLRGKLAEQKGDLDAAQQAYKAAHKVDATYVPNLLSLGKLLIRNEEWDDALKIFQTLLLHQMSIEDNQQKVELYYYLGQVRLQKGDDRRARDMFNRALGIDPDHAPSQEALAAL